MVDFPLFYSTSFHLQRMGDLQLAPDDSGNSIKDGGKSGEWLCGLREEMN